MLKFKFYFLLMIGFVYSYANTSNAYQSLFTISNNAYENGEYSKSKEGYLELLNDGYFSKELFLNLGNAYYKLDSIPHAILFYEKGLKVAPGNENLIHNIKVCNKLIKDKSSVKESIHITDWIYVFLGKSTNYWANASILLMLLCFILLSLFLFAKGNLLKKATFYTAIVSLTLSLITIFFAWLSNDKLQDTNYCILFTPHIWIKAEPSENAESNFKLHEGSKMKIIDENENWIEISYDDKIGWIEKKEVKRI